MESQLNDAYGMSEADYQDRMDAETGAAYDAYLDGDDLETFNQNEADDYRDEGMDDYDPSDEDDMYGGWDDFDEYMGGE